ncbi:MAG: hypothetical protein HOG49_28450 [Candidatus Scalindua sp.]|nr:hypothetical protein [Candidatus Scalindua sp.]
MKMITRINARAMSRASSIYYEDIDLETYWSASWSGHLGWSSYDLDLVGVSWNRIRDYQADCFASPLRTPGVSFFRD